MNAPERLTFLEPTGLQGFADERWDQAIVPALRDYIAIPAKSPMFDKDWAANGHIERAVRDAAAWVERQRGAHGPGVLQGLTREVVRMRLSSACRAGSATSTGRVTYETLVRGLTKEGRPAITHVDTKLVKEDGANVRTTTTGAWTSSSHK